MSETTRRACLINDYRCLSSQLFQQQHPFDLTSSDSEVMSRTREDMKGGTAHSSVHVAAPRLVGGGVGYAIWKPQMNVHLQRIGAEGIHTTVMLSNMAGRDRSI